jgi:nicotinamide mononucleotide adenylyltransferase
LAWEKSERVIVGITNPDPSVIVQEKLNAHRHLPEENPFTFTERLMMIQATLREEGYPMERIFIVPFPIHHSERWRHYVPQGTAMFVVAYSPWEMRKAERMKQAGLEVVMEDSLSKGISGQKIRKLIATGGDWQQFVPPAVARFISKRGDVGRF